MNHEWVKRIGADRFLAWHCVETRAECVAEWTGAGLHGLPLPSHLGPCWLEQSSWLLLTELVLEKLINDLLLNSCESF